MAQSKPQLLLYIGTADYTKSPKVRHRYKLFRASSLELEGGHAMKGNPVGTELVYKKRLEPCQVGHIIEVLMDEDHTVEGGGRRWVAKWANDQGRLELEVQERATVGSREAEARARKLSKESRLQEAIQPLREAYWKAPARYKHAMLMALLQEIQKRP